MAICCGNWDKNSQSKVFRFENYWLNLDDFVSVVVQGLSALENIIDPAKLITAKFKNLRRALKDWKQQFPRLAVTINNIKLVLHFLETIEVFKDLSLPKWNFRNIVTEKLIFLLKQQKIYWKQRGKIRWVREGDAGTKFFHAHATINHRRNTISTLQDSSGSIYQNHEEKAALLWDSFKERLGTSEFNSMIFYLNVLLQRAEGLQQLETPFTREKIDGIVTRLPNDNLQGLMDIAMNS